MKKKRHIAWMMFCVLLMLLVLPFSVHAKDYPNEDSLDSKQVAVINADNGFLVYTKNADERIPTGAATKIMTAILALEYYEGRLDTPVTVPASATRGLEGSAVLNLKADEHIPAIDLIHATLVAGMNDAANTLAIAVGGNLKDFVTMMNEKAKEIGAQDTLYLNATGLSSSAYTTVADLALIARYAYEDPLFMEISSKRFYQVAATDKNPAVTIYAKNPLITTQSKYYYSYAQGMTAGYSSEDGAQIISAVSYGTYPYICVVAGSKENSSGTIGGYADVKNLLAWASYNFSERKILDKSKILCELPVRAGEDVSHVLVIPEKNVYAFLDTDADLSQITLSQTLYHESLTAPVAKGEVVGSALLILDGEPIGSVDLIAKSAVKRSASGGFLLAVETVLTSPFFLVPLAIVLLFFGFKVRIRIRKIQKHRYKSVKTVNNKNNQS
ncbi:MAG: D-alanyl-D-alanine carboxypeptidase [Clostridia bacterium]|nr:D-alanyl-D-alanine carboxypeptidase [Clostridia bacterium]